MFSASMWLTATTTETCGVQKTTHYYSQDERFEKSLDIYRVVVVPPNGTETAAQPSSSASFIHTSTKEQQHDEAAAASPIVVLLVVGSGWLGHHWSIYRATSWWNSAGPKTIAQSCGHGRTTCVCIRHSGAFFHVPRIWSKPAVVTIRYVVVVVLLATALLVPNASSSSTTLMSLIVWAAAASTLGGLAMASIVGQGSATLDDMVDDVAQAIAWVQAHPELCCHQPTALSLESTTAVSFNNVPMILGGYSSGGHVAACLLQRPDVWQRHGLPHDPASLFAGIFYVSGVLAVQPCTLCNVPPTTSTYSDHPTNSMDHEEIVVGRNKPRWLTDFVMHAVWGPTWASTIPSPIENDKPTQLPHLIIGNHHEVWGWPWLDIFFCSSEYAQRLRQCGVPNVVYQPVPSDHWNILASRHLRDIMRTELPNLVQLRQRQPVRASTLRD
jgi:alpha/beta hydrolase fold